MVVPEIKLVTGSQNVVGVMGVVRKHKKKSCKLAKASLEADPTTRAAVSNVAISREEASSMAQSRTLSMDGFCLLEGKADRRMFVSAIQHRNIPLHLRWNVRETEILVESDEASYRRPSRMVTVYPRLSTKMVLS